MAIARDVVEILIKADGTVAGQAFDQLGDKAEKSARKIGKPSSVFEELATKAQAKGGIAAKAMDSLGLSAQSAGALMQGALIGGVTAAGAAIAGFAVKGVMDFQRVALEAGKLAESTGLNVEQASRWNEVAQDVGISTGDVEIAFRKLAQNMGKSPEKFAALGVTARDAKTGLVDMNGSILNAIDLLNRTPDAAEKAKLGAELFGKNWSAMSEFIGRGAVELKAKLEEVSQAKVVNEAELARARKFRDVMDNLKDVVEDLSLTVGGELVAEFTTLYDILGPVVDLLGQAGDASSVAGTKFTDLGGKLLGWLPGVKALTDIWHEYQKGQGDAAAASEQNKAALEATTNVTQHYGDTAAYTAKAQAEWALKMKETTEGTAAQQAQATQAAAAVEGMSSAYDKAKAAVEGYADAVLASLNSDLGLRNAEDAVAESVQKTLEAMQGAAEAAKQHGASSKEAAAAQDEAADASRNLEGSVLATAAAALKAAQDQATFEGRTLSAKEKADAQTAALQRLAGQFPALAGLIGGYVAKINAIPGARSTTVSVTAVGVQEAESAISRIARTRTVDLIVRPVGAVVARADGGHLDAGQAAIVGERRPELFVPDRPGTILPSVPSLTAGQSGAGGGGTVVNNITIHAGSNPQQIVDALRVYNRQSGPVPVKVAA